MNQNNTNKKDEPDRCNQCIHRHVCIRKIEIERVFHHFVAADKMEKVSVLIAEICDEYKKDPDYGDFNKLDLSKKSAAKDLFEMI